LVNLAITMWGVWLGGDRVGKAFLRAAVVAALAAAMPLAPAAAATITASVSASVVKPLSLTSLRGLDLGTITLNPGTWSNATVSLTRAGAFSCSANLVCSGAPQTAQFNVAGSKAYTVVISAPKVTLTNQSDSSKTLLLTLDVPSTITLTNSGAPGTNFSVGGSLVLNSTTADGTYSGTITITADYQ
jgi:hypothetical protein